MNNHLLAKRIARIAASVSLLLLIPLILTLLGSGVEGEGWYWKPGDFLFAFSLLFAAGTAYELITQRLRKNTSRAVIAITITIVVFLIWVEAAVDAVSRLVNALLG